MRESSQSWRDLLLDLKRRGLTTASQIAVADGALGFWKALGEVWPTTREQRCWVHKTANILNKLPKSLHSKAKRALQDIWMAETKRDAITAFNAFAKSYRIKYDKAVDCLIKDCDALLASYDFPAEHWKHFRNGCLAMDNSAKCGAFWFFDHKLKGATKICVLSRIVDRLQGCGEPSSTVERLYRRARAATLHSCYRPSKSGQG